MASTPPQVQFIADQLDLLQTITTIGTGVSGISLIGIISCYAVFKRLRRSTGRYAFFTSIFMLLGVIGNFIGKWVNQSDIPTAVCQIDAWLISFGDIFSWGWVLAMAFSCFCTLVITEPTVGSNPTRTRLRIEMIFWWPFNLFTTWGLASAPLFISQYGLGRMYGITSEWCWIQSNYLNYRLYLYFIPLWFVIITSFVILVIIAMAAWTDKGIFKSSLYPYIVSSISQGSAYVTHYSAFLFTFMMIWLLPSIDKVYAVFNDEQHSLALVILSTILYSFRGFLWASCFPYVHFFSPLQTVFKEEQTSYTTRSPTTNNPMPSMVDSDHVSHHSHLSSQGKDIDNAVEKFNNQDLAYAPHMEPSSDWQDEKSRSLKQPYLYNAHHMDAHDLERPNDMLALELISPNDNMTEGRHLTNISCPSLHSNRHELVSNRPERDHGRLSPDSLASRSISSFRDGGQPNGRRSPKLAKMDSMESIYSDASELNHHHSSTNAKLSPPPEQVRHDFYNRAMMNEDDTWYMKSENARASSSPFPPSFQFDRRGSSGSSQTSLVPTAFDLGSKVSKSLNQALQKNPDESQFIKPVAAATWNLAPLRMSSPRSLSPKPPSDYSKWRQYDYDDMPRSPSPRSTTREMKLEDDQKESKSPISEPMEMLREPGKGKEQGVELNKSVWDETSSGEESGSENSFYEVPPSPCTVPKSNTILPPKNENRKLEFRRSSSTDDEWVEGVVVSRAERFSTEHRRPTIITHSNSVSSLKAETNFTMANDLPAMKMPIAKNYKESDISTLLQARIVSQPPTVQKAPHFMESNLPSPTQTLSGPPSPSMQNVSSPTEAHYGPPLPMTPKSPFFMKSGENFIESEGPSSPSRTQPVRPLSPRSPVSQSGSPCSPDAYNMTQLSSKPGFRFSFLDYSFPINPIGASNPVPGDPPVDPISTVSKPLESSISKSKSFLDMDSDDDKVGEIHHMEYIANDEMSHDGQRKNWFGRWKSNRDQDDASSVSSRDDWSERANWIDMS